MHPQNYLRFLGRALFVSVFCASLPVFAQAVPVLAKELASQKEVFQVKLDSLKEAQKSDIESLNKRIDDALTTTGQAVDRFGVVTAWIGGLVTALLAVLGLLGFITVTRKTKIEAEQTAKAWFEENAVKLRKEIERLEKRAQEAHLSMDASVKRVSDRETEANQAIDRQQVAMGRGQDNKAQHSAPSSADASILQRRDEELRQQPEASYSFDDWNARAHAAYASGKFVDATYFWERASEVPGAGAANVAQALFNKAVTQGETGDNAAALETYNDVIRRYNDAPEMALRKQVARALINKSVAQGETGDNAGSLETLNGVIRRYDDAPDAALREQVARALINKSFRQGKMGDNAGALETLNDLIRRYDDAPEVALREHVARALINMGVTQRETGDSAGTLETYNGVIRRYGDAPEAALQEQVARAYNGLGWMHFLNAKSLWKTNRVAAEQNLLQAREQFDLGATKMIAPNGAILGNRAYTRFLQGDIEGAEADFGAALTAKNSGGKWLYEATLKDIEEHPVDEDVGMRAMVERLWQAYEAAGHA